MRVPSVGWKIRTWWTKYYILLSMKLKYKVHHRHIISDNITANHNCESLANAKFQLHNSNRKRKKMMIEFIVQWIQGENALLICIFIMSDHQIQNVSVISFKASISYV